MANNGEDITGRCRDPGEIILSEHEIEQILTGNTMMTPSTIQEQEAAQSSSSKQIGLDFEALPLEHQYQLTRDMYQTAYRTRANIAVLNATHAHRLDVMDTKERKQIWAEERADERHLDRESEMLKCFFGSDKCIWAVIERPSRSGKPFRVIDVRDMKLTELVSVTPSGKKVSTFRLSWESNTRGILCKEDDLNIDSFPRVLQKAGIALNSSRRNRTSVAEKTLALLRANSFTVELPFGFGWHKNTNDIWRFTPSFNGSFLEVTSNDN